MKKILIGDEFFDKTIFDQQWFYEEHPLLKKYQTIEIEDEYYIDCVIDDFDLIDNAYIFNVDKYDTRKQKESDQRELAELQPELDKLTEDLVQVQAEAIIPDLEERKARFQVIHNRIREIKGKEPRKYFS